MKITLITFLGSLSLVLSLSGQSPSREVSPVVQTSPARAAASTAAPTATGSPAVLPTPDTEDSLDDRIQKKVKKHLNVSVGKGQHEFDGPIGDGAEWIAVPIVLVVFLSVFGAPVLVVAVIMYFSMSKNRALHRTVRMMVEKGQEVPAALLNPPPAVRQRSDMRRGIVLLMVGLGLMLFLAAVNDWEGGAWSVGLIPLLIGAGYLLVWKLEGKRDNVAPLP